MPPPHPRYGSATGGMQDVPRSGGGGAVGLGGGGAVVVSVFAVGRR